MPLNNDDIKQLINILQKGLIGDDSVTTDESSDTISKKSNTKSASTRRQNKKVAKDTDGQYNKFESMPEKNMHKDDTKIDKMLAKYSPTQRTRGFSLIDVVCRVCGRRDSVNPALACDAGDRYKCNKCSKIPG